MSVCMEGYTFPMVAHEASLDEGESFSMEGVRCG